MDAHDEPDMDGIRLRRLTIFLVIIIAASILALYLIVIFWAPDENSEMDNSHLNSLEMHREAVVKLEHAVLMYYVGEDRALNREPLYKRMMKYREMSGE